MEKERNQSALIESVLPPVPEAVSIAAITTYPLPFVQPYQASEIVERYNVRIINKLARIYEQ
jgi:hypothetical protein